MSKRLFIVGYESRQWFDIIDKSSGDDKVLTLGCAPETFLFKCDRHLFFDASSVSSQSREKLAEFVINFFSELPRRQDNNQSLAEILFPGHPEYWWFLDFTEKSVYRGQLIDRLYFLLLIREALNAYSPSEVIIDLSDECLTDVIRQALVRDCRVIDLRHSAAPEPSLLPFIAKSTVVASITFVETLLAKCIAGKPKRLTEESKNASIGFYSIFPGWWRQAWDDNRADVFFDDLSQAFVESGRNVFHLSWLSGNPWQWIKRHKDLRKLTNKANFIFLQRLLPLISLFHLLSPVVLLSGFRLYKASDVYFEQQFYGFNITSFVRYDLLRSIGNRELFRNILLSKAFAQIKHIDAIILRCEFQPFERAIVFGVSNHAIIAGFQHSSIGESYLSHMFLKEDIRGIAGCQQHTVPMPDHIICSGPYPALLMQKNGFPSSRVHVSGAVRYSGLAKEKRNALSKKEKTLLDDEFAVLVLVPLEVAEAEMLGFLLGMMLNEIAKPIKVVLKGHPSIDNTSIMLRQVKSTGCEHNMTCQPVRGSIYDSLHTADLVLTTGSTVSFEAMVLNVPSIVVVNNYKCSYTLASLYAVKESVLWVNSATELIDMVTSIISDNGFLDEIKSHWPEAINAVFSDIENENPKQNFIEIVENLITQDRH